MGIVRLENREYFFSTCQSHQFDQKLYVVFVGSLHSGSERLHRQEIVGLGDVRLQMRKVEENPLLMLYQRLSW